MSLRNKSVLVTGGAGFVGSHLCEALVQHEAQVTIVDNLSNGRMENLSRIASTVRFLKMDVCTPDFIDLVSGSHYDYIFHLAANAYVPPSVKDPTYDFQVNLAAPFHLLEALRRSSSKAKLLMTSSAGVYGNPIRVPIREEDVAVPISPYGVSKLTVDRYTYVFCQLYGLKAVSIRLFSAYGPRHHKQVVFDFIRKIMNNPTGLEIIGDGTQMRDLVFVEDVVQAFLIASENAPMRGEVYNVASGTAYSIKEVAEMIFKVMGMEPRYFYSGHTRPGDPDIWIASIERMRALGYSPKFTLEAGIGKTVEWCRSLQYA